MGHWSRGVRPTIVAIAAALLASSATAQGGQEPLAKAFPPAWRVGQWWVVETYVMGQDPHGHEGEAPRTRIERRQHRFTVVKEQPIGGQPCLEITVVPTGKRDAADDSALLTYVLWVRKSDGTIAKYAKYQRHKGRPDQPPSLDHAVELPRPQPVVVDRGICPVPLDLPWFPAPAAGTHYTDESSAQRATQVVWQLEQMVGGPVKPVLHVALVSRAWHGVRMQAWLPGRPWWTEWTACSPGAGIGRALHARLVDWSAKPRGRYPPH